MNKPCEVLVADDRREVRLAIGKLLRAAGISSTLVADGPSALAALRERDFEVLVADIKMPGNEHLELIRQLPVVAPTTRAILVTGCPDAETAIDAIRLPVTSYLVKPFDPDELVAMVRAATTQSHLLDMCARTRNRIERWSDELDAIEENHTGQTGRPVTLRAFIDLNVANVIETVEDLAAVAEPASHGPGADAVCRLLECPRLDELRQILRHAVEVIESTKTAFKSKELARLRAEIELVLSTSTSRRPGQATPGN